MAKMTPQSPSSLQRDLKILATFVDIYCQAHHTQQIPLALPTYDIPALVGRPLNLCSECAKLLSHALVKRSHCPLDPKPACKDCPKHCYHPSYRTKIQEVMRYSGRHMVLRGRLDYLIKLFF